MKIILTVVFILLAYVNYRHINIGFLSIVQIDEWAFHGSLEKMYEGFIKLNPVAYFSHGFLSYGHFFWAINFFATLPFFLSNNAEMTIYIPRMISTLFALGSLFYMYKISKLYVDKQASILIVLLILSMPGFWINAMWFHPDWMMTFFIILSIYYYSKDNFEYKKYFWYGTIAFGFALASKFQAITFYPFLFIYIFNNNILQRNVKYLKSKIIIFIKSILVTIGIFVMLNPYLLHPVGFSAWLNSFLLNMASNKTNHGSGVILNWEDKLFNVIDTNYLSIVAWIALLVFILYSIYRYLYKRERHILDIITIYVVINILYLFIAVNKDWQHYYLNIIIVSTLLFTIKFKFSKQLLIVAFLINSIYMVPKTYAKFILNPVKEIHKEQSKELINAFKDVKTKSVNILISPYSPFEFNRIGLTYSQINYIWGPLNKSMFILEDYISRSNLKDPRKFIKKDFIIIKKDDLYFHKDKFRNRINKNDYSKAIKLIENFDNNGSLGYEKFKETKYFYIWRIKN